jgi:hypothetical protein
MIIFANKDNEKLSDKNNYEFLLFKPEMLGARA